MNCRITQTADSYAVVNFEVASFSSFGNFPKRSFCDSEIDDGSSGMNAICSQTEVADDVIFSGNVDAVQYYTSIDLWVAIFGSF